MLPAPDRRGHRAAGGAPPGTDAVYFALAQYTTLGHGEAIPLHDWALLGPITAANGLLLFGWSTAVIFEVVRTTIPGLRA
jgi:Ion channel